MNLPHPFQNALILTGPTASGKSALALELAERLDAEIIAMDSMTLYRGMDIGTAKPTVDDRARIPHHLIDVLDPSESGNVAWWLKEAGICCQEIEARGKQALFVGGTPFYLKALVQGLFDAPPVDRDLRQQLEDEAAAIGLEAMHRKLAEVDPASASRLHPNDVRRVVRALEIWHQTGKPLSEQQQQGWWSKSDASEESTVERCLVVDLPREELYTRINQRVEQMIQAGWLEEVARLRSMPWSSEASRALGYQEIEAFLEGKCPLNETIALIQTRSRQFAKRQLTWFRSLKGVRFVEGKLTFNLWHRRMS